MPRRQKIDFWTESLPAEIEWGLALVFLVGWAIGSAIFYWKVAGRIEDALNSLAPLGITADESSLRPMFGMIVRLAPFAGLPIGLTAWHWARKKLLGAVASAT